MCPRSLRHRKASFLCESNHSAGRDGTRHPFFIIPNCGIFCNRGRRLIWIFLGGRRRVLLIFPLVFGRRRPSRLVDNGFINSYFGFVFRVCVAFCLFLPLILYPFWNLFRVCFLFVYNLSLQYTHFVWYNGGTSKREPTDAHRRRAKTTAVGTLRRVRPHDEGMGIPPPHRKEGRS